MKAKKIIARLVAIIGMIAFMAMCGCSETECISGVLICLFIMAACAFTINRLPNSVWD